MNTLKFYSWMLKQIDREGPVGDLALDIRRDKGFPQDSSDIEALHGHLTRNRACHEAHSALDDAFREFLSQATD